MAEMDIVAVARAWDKFELGQTPPPPLRDGQLADEIEMLRRAVWELYSECKKLGMHDNAMSTETAEAVAAIADLE